MSDSFARRIVTKQGISCITPFACLCVCTCSSSFKWIVVTLAACLFPPFFFTSMWTEDGTNQQWEVQSSFFVLKRGVLCKWRWVVLFFFFVFWIVRFIKDLLHLFLIFFIFYLDKKKIKIKTSYWKPLIRYLSFFFFFSFKYRTRKTSILIGSKVSATKWLFLSIVSTRISGMIILLFALKQKNCLKNGSIDKMAVFEWGSSKE